MKKIPNLLSMIRILFSIIIIFSPNDIFYIICCLVASMTDVADGYLARKLNATTHLGAQLDSIGDFVFIATNLIFYFIRLDQYRSLAVFLIGLIFAVRMVNLFLMKHKFGQLRVTRTIANRISGGVLFIGVPAAIIFGWSSIYFILLLSLVSFFAAAEEFLILLTTPKKQYKPNRNTFL